MKATLLILIAVCGISGVLNACDPLLQVLREKGHLSFRIAGHLVEAKSTLSRYSNMERLTGVVTVLTDASTTKEVKLQVALIRYSIFLIWLIYSFQ